MPPRLGAQDIQGVGREVRVGLGLHCKQPDLRSVAVRDHDPVVPGQLRESVNGYSDIAMLGL
jgi:hypothetical protein